MMVATLDPDETPRMGLQVDQELLSAFFNVFAEIMLSVIAKGDLKLFNYISFNTEELITAAADRFVETNQIDLTVN